MFVLKHNETGKYVAPAGSQHSYTAKLEEARQFPTREAAEADRCVDSETIVPTSDLLNRAS